MFLEELKQYGIKYEQITQIKELSNKDGIIVHSFEYLGVHYVLKQFMNKIHTREILNYRLLNELELPTMNVIQVEQNSILLEDINFNISYRLATKSDLEKTSIITSLAKWYRRLHDQGRRYFKDHPKMYLYSEIEDLTDENLALIRNHLCYGSDDFWQNINELVSLSKRYTKANRTLNYNDFSYVNVIVARDFKDAYLFDYNFMGEGLAYFDIRNVLSGIPSHLHPIFLNEYGEYNKIEETIDAILQHLVSINIAFQRASFPQWAEKSIVQMTSKAMQNNVLEAIRMLKIEMEIPTVSSSSKEGI